MFYMDTTPITQSPFGALSFVAAPALLTNATSLLVMSTINRMLHTRDSMRQLLTSVENKAHSPEEKSRLLQQINRIEEQGAHLLKALHLIYISLAAFACATLVTLLGTGLSYFGVFWPHVFAGLGVALGFVGVGGLSIGCANLFYATRISLTNIHDEALAARRILEKS
jgi:hypothetical protein